MSTQVHDTAPPARELLAISLIRTDGGTQPRAELSSDTVVEYREAMRAGSTFPPVVVFYDGAYYWLADGFHRHAAWIGLGEKKIPVDIRQGTVRDAILFSVSANAGHGLRRTNADKRRAVARLLGDDEWVKWSDREIARRCAVSHPFVMQMRASLVTVTSENESWACTSCNEQFPEAVWHCPKCDHHWQVADDECKNCRSMGRTTEQAEQNRAVESTPPVERTYTTKHGTVATMAIPPREPRERAYIKPDPIVHMPTPQAAMTNINLPNEPQRAAETLWSIYGPEFLSALHACIPAVIAEKGEW